MVFVQQQQAKQHSITFGYSTYKKRLHRSYKYSGFSYSLFYTPNARSNRKRQQQHLLHHILQQSFGRLFSAFGFSSLSLSLLSFPAHCVYHLIVCRERESLKQSTIITAAATIFVTGANCRSRSKERGGERERKERERESDQEKPAATTDGTQRQQQEYCYTTTHAATGSVHTHVLPF